MEHKLTHFDERGQAVMADVSGKAETERVAVACGRIHVSGEVLRTIREGTASKGDVLAVARIAGIMAAKRTGDWIPLCHPLSLTRCAVDFRLDEARREVEAVCTVCTCDRTGVEMEALTGVSAALLTVYDMCKAMDRGMELTGIRLLKKSGGRSGTWERKGEESSDEPAYD